LIRAQEQDLPLVQHPPNPPKPLWPKLLFETSCKSPLNDLLIISILHAMQTLSFNGNTALFQCRAKKTRPNCIFLVQPKALLTRPSLVRRIGAKKT
jgi:hypothetical protein